jgi:hypothetical protein
VVGEHDDDFLPDDASLIPTSTSKHRERKNVRRGREKMCDCAGGGVGEGDLQIIDIVDFIEDDEFNVANEIGSSIKHTPKNFRRHDKT